MGEEVFKLKVGKRDISYKVERTSRKTVGVIFDPEKGVIIRAPEKVNKNKIQNIVKKKSNWILKKIEEHEKIKGKPKQKEFLSGEKLSYLGRRYRIKSEEIKNSKKVKIKFYQGKFIIKTGDKLSKKAREQKVREKLIEWYKEHGKEFIQKRVDKYTKKLGISPNKIRIKKQQKRWGSCSKNKTLNFNWKLLMAPVSVIDYVVVHELCHLLYKNHSKKYWTHVSTLIPDYKEKQDWLRVNGNELEI